MNNNNNNNNNFEDRIKNFIVPIDGEGYTKSFTIEDINQRNQLPKNQNENPIEFFNHYGFLVVRDCLAGEECDKTVSEIFDIIESKSPSFKRNQISTWDHFPQDDSIVQYGSPSRPSVFKHQFMMNRQNPNIYKVFAAILQNEDLMVNHDRCCFFRPTTNVTINGNIVPFKKEWTTKDNVHLDMNPFNWMKDETKTLDQLRYTKLSEFIVENNQPSQKDGTQLQGVINLLDNKEEDGGYVVVPGFHTIFQEYFNSKKPDYEPPSMNFNRNEFIFKRAKRISMRKGSLVLWDQRMPHGSFSNHSSRPRMAQFIKIFPTSTVSQERYDARAKVLTYILQNDFTNDSSIPLTKLGKKLFGIPNSNLPTLD
eukprot:gene8265-10155_t